ncbi:MAG: DNA-binding protein [Flavobacterium sp.]|nr:MAG: DNA-binding protein [Flavobacterium sp.]
MLQIITEHAALNDCIEAAIQKAFAKLVPQFQQKHTPEPEERLTRNQLANYLGVTLPTVDRYRSRSVFPYYQTGRTIYFKKSEVDNALSVGKKKGGKTNV